MANEKAVLVKDLTVEMMVMKEVEVVMVVMMMEIRPLAPGMVGLVGHGIAVFVHGLDSIACSKAPH